MAALVSLPIAISQVAGRYFLYDTDAITYLRREHRITGVLIGTLSQAPQQNVFLGIPLELMPEEVRLLMERDIAYLIDDVHHHHERLRNVTAAENMIILSAFRRQGSEAARAAHSRAGKRKEAALKRRGITSQQEKPPDRTPSGSSEHNVDEDELLFASPANSFPTRTLGSPASPTSTATPEPEPFGITPATSYPPLASPTPSSESSGSSLPEVPTSYPLFRHLHNEGYFLSPGLRFGAQYMAYPGDSLRFHSHFLAVGREWEEEWELGELVGGGRLGTGVKKGFLVGGEVTAKGHKSQEDNVTEHRSVRAFCIEWGGM